jgi:hypothetical protein
MERWTVTDNDLVILDTPLEKTRSTRDTRLPDDVAFELFSCEQLLRDYDLRLKRFRTASGRGTTVAFVLDRDFLRDGPLTCGSAFTGTRSTV